MSVCSFINITNNNSTTDQTLTVSTNDSDMMNSNNSNNMNNNAANTSNSNIKNTVISLATPVISLSTTNSNLTNSEKPILTLVTNNSIPNIKSFNLKDHTHGSGSKQPTSTTLNSPTNSQQQNLSIVSLKTANQSNNKQIFRQHVTIGNNSRINLTGLSNNRPEPIQYLYKNSPQKTIVIMSKPSSTSPSSTINESQLQQPTPDTNNNNLIYNFNNIKPITLIPINNKNQFNPNNNQAVKILNLDSDINKFQTFGGSANQFYMNHHNLNNHVAPSTFETIEISTATIEIDSTVHEEEIVTTTIEENNDKKIELFEEERRVSSPTPTHPPPPPVHKKTNQKTPRKDITRCICEMDHSDGFMISCDKCLVWQHLACMEINPKKIPEKFYCEKCEPRPINIPRSKQIQTNYINNLKKKLTESDKKLDDSNENKENNKEDDKLENSTETLPKSSNNKNNSFKKVKRNQYSNEFIKFQMDLKETNNNNNNNNNFSFSLDLNDPNLYHNNNVNKLKVAEVNNRGTLKNIVQLECLKLVKVNNINDDLDDNDISPTSHSSSIYRVKLNQNVKKNEIVGEYIGRVMTYDEYLNNQKNEKTSYCLFHNIKLTDLNNNNNNNNNCNDLFSSSMPSSSYTSSSSSSNLIMKTCIDSSIFGNITRFVRKSCQANSRLKHVIDTNGNLHFLIITTTNIPKGSELTLPYEIAYEPNEFNLKCFICNCNNDNNKCMLKSKISRFNPKLINSKNDSKNKSKKKTKTRDNSNDSIKLIEDIPVKQQNKLKEILNENENKKTKQDKANSNNNGQVKSLSREDRKLASYVRVIERLEKQGKRKKELKEQKEAAKLMQLQSNPNEEQTKQQKQKTSIIKSLKNKKVENTPNEHQLADKEIENILKNEHPTTSINNSTDTSSMNKPHVKSPDYSFVNLSIQPRPTLHLLQRNLSSTSYSSSKMDNEIPTNSESIPKITSTDKNLFNPKKHWLKCSSTVQDETVQHISPNNTPPVSTPPVIETSTTPIPTISTNTIQPPKKRRHIFQDQSSNNDSSVSSFSIKLEEQISEISSSISYTNALNQQYTNNDFNQTIFNYIFQEQMKQQHLDSNNNEVKINEEPLLTPSSSETSFINGDILNISESAADKRKKVSLAEYRQRKTETKTSNNNEISGTSSSSSLNSSPLRRSIDDKDCLKQDAEQLNDQNNKSKLTKLLNQIISNKKRNSNSSFSDIKHDLSSKIDKLSSKLSEPSENCVINPKTFCYSKLSKENDSNDAIIIKEENIEKSTSQNSSSSNNQNSKQPKQPNYSDSRSTTRSRSRNTNSNSRSNSSRSNSSRSNSSNSSIISVSSIIILNKDISKSNQLNENNKKEKFSPDNNYHKTNVNKRRSISPNEPRHKRHNYDYAERKHEYEEYYSRRRSISPNTPYDKLTENNFYQRRLDYIENGGKSEKYLNQNNIYKKRLEPVYYNRHQHNHYSRNLNRNDSVYRRKSRSRSKTPNRNRHDHRYYSNNYYKHGSSNRNSSSKSRNGSLPRNLDQQEALKMLKKRKLDEMLDEYNSKKSKSIVAKKRSESLNRDTNDSDLIITSKKERNSSIEKESVSTESSSSKSEVQINNHYSNENEEDYEKFLQYKNKYLPKHDLRFHLNNKSKYHK